MIDSDELRLLAESVRKVVGSAWDEDRPSGGFWRQAGEAGWTAFRTPAGGDGTELPAIAVYTIARELGAGGIFGHFPDSIALSSLLSERGDDEKVAAILDEVAAGEAQLAFLDTIGASDAMQDIVRTSSLPPATLYVATVAPDRLDITRLERSNPLSMTGADPGYVLPGSDVAGEVLVALSVPDASIAKAGLLRDLVACAQATGAHRYLLGLTSDFAQTRVQFGQPIVAFQGLRHILVDVFSWLEAAELLLARAFSSFDEYGVLPDRSRAAVVFVRERAWWALQRAYEVLGGVGFMTEHPLNHYTREMLMSLAAIGATDSHAERLAELIEPGAWRHAS